MRTLTDTMTAYQKRNVKDTRYKVVLTYGEDTHTFDKSRIMDIEHDEHPYSQKAKITLNNADGALTELDLKGYHAVISYGLVTSAGEEYEATDPLTVLGQELSSAPGKMVCVLELQGIPNDLQDDKASEAFILDEDHHDYKDTVKQFLTRVLTADIPPFTHCKEYNIIWDNDEGDDPLLNYKPKDGFRIYTGGNRLAAARKLLDYTKCAMRYRSDGIHIFMPVTSGSTYDYEYSLEHGSHTFFAKAYRKRLVIPNYVVVKSNPDDDPQYEGHATDESSDIVEKRAYYMATLESDSEAEDIAEAIIQKARLEAKGGSGVIHLNLGAEVLDYVKITDSRQKDEVRGNIGWIHRRINTEKKEWQMSFGFGGWATTKGLLDALQTDNPDMQLNRLGVKDLYAENINADNINLAWIDPDGNLDLPKTGINLDDLPDGEVYAKVATTCIEAGRIKIDEQAVYKAGYDPTDKFDLEANSLDDIPDGSAYARIRATEVTSGHITLTSETIVKGGWYDEAGVYIDADYGIMICGSSTAFRTRATKTGPDVVYIGSDGKINIVGTEGMVLRPIAGSLGGYIYSTMGNSLTIVAGSGGSGHYLNLVGDVRIHGTIKLPVGTNKY